MSDEENNNDRKFSSLVREGVCVGGGGGRGVTKVKVWDQYQYLGNCPPTPPLTQQQSIDNNLRLMLV